MNHDANERVALDNIVRYSLYQGDPIEITARLVASYSEITASSLLVLLVTLVSLTPYLIRLVTPSFSVDTVG